METQDVFSVTFEELAKRIASENKTSQFFVIDEQELQKSLPPGLVLIKKESTDQI